MQLNHPDKNPANIEEATKKTVEILLAYEILKDDITRRDFDTIRSHENSPNKADNAYTRTEYTSTRNRYQETENEARERIRKWLDQTLGNRPLKRRRSYSAQNNGSVLDNFMIKLDNRLNGRVWEYRLRNRTFSVSNDQIQYSLRILCDPTKFNFRENHPDWVAGYYHGALKAGTKEDAVYNKNLAYQLIGDILENETLAYKISVFFGAVGGGDVPWRCYIDIDFLLEVTGFDIFLQSSINSLSKFAKENELEVARTFNYLIEKVEITPEQLFNSKPLRSYIARKAENILRKQYGKRVLKDLQLD